MSPLEMRKGKGGAGRASEVAKREAWRRVLMKGFITSSACVGATVSQADKGGELTSPGGCLGLKLAGRQERSSGKGAARR